MSLPLNGELVPLGGGDVIPLIRPILTIGRRETCDICLRFPNISGKHCELTFRDGYWYIRDLNSTNGVKVAGVRVQEKMVHPDEEISIGKRSYMLRYELPLDRRNLDENKGEDIMSHSLLERAGLERRGKKKRDAKGRVDPMDLDGIFPEDD